jgi:hypothetical protein
VNPNGIAPQVENAVNVSSVGFNFVIDCERESFAKHSVEAKMIRVDTGESAKLLKVGKD